ncbi:CAP domain-containing protein [Phormidium sp. FACHB-592]|uniref:CAP domain-containing protein n=1 Tax=Stenomitos frigidus AS-A4 TaxID=2933935 RepID=A0ABV0KN15_9CYAN|nr:CAP domain-containing protein [Phormidium sp. FACHB-592]MBD2074387.1 CAP domain-containing protein [Phormidium sp. FACHB-592]
MVSQVFKTRVCKTGAFKLGLLKAGTFSALAIAGSFVLSHAFGSGLASAQLSPLVQQQIAQAAPSFQSLEQAVLTQVNQYRASRKLPPLKMDSRISEQSRLHSQAMASGGVPFSHNGFKQRVQAIARTLPYSRAAENVAFNQGYSDPVRQAVQGWLKSPGHLKNIEGSFDTTGVGIAKNAKGEYYFTQVFIRRR